IGKIRHFCGALRAENFDLVVNFTFSPISSYLTQLVCSQNSRVIGYSRTADGYLHIAGDTSAYFYAQVGVERHNRIHLADLFAMMMDLDIAPGDWGKPSSLPSTRVPGDYIVLHVGASDDKKMYSVWKWQSVVQKILRSWGGSIVLIGSGEKETAVAERIQAITDDVRIINFVGKTSITDSMALIANSLLFVGCDSGPLQMANLVGKVSINVSFKTVRYWETGPKVPGSFVLYADAEDELPSDRVSSQILSILNKTASIPEAISVTQDMICYQGTETEEQEFGWQVLEAIYLGKEWPKQTSASFKHAIRRLSEMNTVMLEQLQKIETSSQAQALMEILNRGDEVISTIGKLEPEVDSLIRWYQTEKSRIAPGDFGAVLGETVRIHGLFQCALDLVQGNRAAEGRAEVGG
ncbi:MAG: glycosyltransferase family 9 protein, partial [Pseudobdellovibrionaceae bacterium]